jgi:ATP-dependent helicase/nuclease subunit A
MVERRLISPAQAAMVQRPWIEWFVETDVGKLLRGNAGKLRREMPIYFAAPPPPDAENAGGLDQTMVRGRIDLLAETDAGLILLDYKTDNIEPGAAKLRARSYAEQMNYYRKALVQMTRKPVARAYIAFLSPRIIHAF